MHTLHALTYTISHEVAHLLTPTEGHNSTWRHTQEALLQTAFVGLVRSVHFCEHGAVDCCAIKQARLEARCSECDEEEKPQLTKPPLPSDKLPGPAVAGTQSKQGLPRKLKPWVPPERALDQEPNLELQQVLREFYRHHAPEKTRDAVEKILRAWAGREAELIKKAKAKYGADAVHPAVAIQPV